MFYITHWHWLDSLCKACFLLYLVMSSRSQMTWQDSRLLTAVLQAEKEATSSTSLSLSFCVTDWVLRCADATNTDHLRSMFCHFMVGIQSGSPNGCKKRSKYSRPGLLHLQDSVSMEWCQPISLQRMDFRLSWIIWRRSILTRDALIVILVSGLIRFFFLLIN